MTIAKITAGDGYTYLTRHVANGDATPEGKQDATDYYTAQGNPPGRWIGRGVHLVGMDGQQVTEDQMRALFGQGEHPDSDAMVKAYIRKHIRAGMTARQRDELTAAAIRHATLGRRFPAYEPLQDFDDRVAQRLAIITSETGREPTQAEVKKVKAEEARRQRAAVAGFDLVFSPVKSAALLWALDERDWVRDAIRQAHEDAMHEALELVEEHAAYTRTGAGGVAQIATNGLMAAAFEHWDSRAGDPNLHTHVAVSSKVQGTDGKWRSLDARALYRITVAASEAYNTAFESHLTSSLGVTFTARPDTTGGREPVREIDGVPFGMVNYFSRRRAAIEKRYGQLVREYRTQHGHDPPAAVTHQLARQANLDTRQGKKPPRSLADKRAAWRAELDERFGAGAAARLMAAVPGRPRPPTAPGQPAGAPDLDHIAERILATVATRRSTWTIWNVRAEAERLLRSEISGLTPERHRDLADAATALAISPQHSICVEAPALLDEPPELRREDGESVFTEHAAGRYTSQAVLDAEQRLLNATRSPTVNGLPGPSVAAALDGFEAITGASLDAGQRALVTAFACDERLLLAGIGPAGSGKTTTMRAYAWVLRQHGRRFVPLATSAAAADVLGRELTVQADNLHKFLHEWTAGRFAARLRSGASVPAGVRMFALRPGDVVLVDEAGMAGTLLLDQLVQIAASRGATVRLLGDDRQLPAVESGGALRLVASQPGTPELTVLHRFRDPDEATATLRLRAGDGTAVDWYAGQDRIRAGSRDAMTEAAYAGWKADMLAGKFTLMAAATNASVTELSARARADRVAAGQVEPTGAGLHDGNVAGRDDWIVTRHNDRRMSVHGGRDWVKNGDAWHVEHRHPDGSLTVRHHTHGGQVRLPLEYVAQHVELLYATTTHRAQGATVDTAHPLITPGMTRENLYVLASRAREKTTFYVSTHDLPFDEDDRVDRVRTDPRAYAAREILLTIIATEGAPMSATETIAAAQEEAVSLATLVPCYLHAAHQDAEQRYAAAAVAALGETGGAELVADPAWGAVVRRLYDAEGDGWDPARLLATVAAQRELGSADSVAEVLAWRIDGYLADRPGPERKDGMLPWVARPCQSADGNSGIARYLDEASELITTRVDELASTAARHRPAWTLLLGQASQDPELDRQWLRHVAIIAAYRDQFKITTNDPQQLLGPYAEPGHAGHKAYWHAAESVLAARHLAGLDPAPAVPTPDARTRAQIATGIYRTLPEHERAAISKELAARLGPLWFGDRATPDQHAATQPAYASVLTAALVQRGHMTDMTEPTREQDPGEPLEADLARRGRPTRRTRRPSTSGTSPAPVPTPSQVPHPRPGTQTPQAPQQRLP